MAGLVVAQVQVGVKLFHAPVVCVHERSPAAIVPSVMFEEATVPAAMSPPTIVPSAIMAEVTLLAPIAVTPVLLIVTSPLMATAVGTLVPLPTMMFAEGSAASLE